MSKDFLEHKGYCGSIEHDLDSGSLYGSVQFINDLLIYEAKTLAELKQAFEDSVNEYLETCEEIGKDPDKPYSGTFNVRVSTELHRQIAQKAYKEDRSLNAAVSDALESYVSPNELVHKHFSFNFQVAFPHSPQVEQKTELKVVVN